MAKELLCIAVRAESEAVRLATIKMSQQGALQTRQRSQPVAQRLVWVVNQLRRRPGVPFLLTSLATRSCSVTGVSAGLAKGESVDGRWDEFCKFIPATPRLSHPVRNVSIATRNCAFSAATRRSYRELTVRGARTGMHHTTIRDSKPIERDTPIK